uniref:Lipid-binding serum glycoprotein C-terminal domain-containing protein n=1 Tax=Rhizophora mucronata TaxID=61149 RepID=A0A2P2J3S6_RHIMU
MYRVISLILSSRMIDAFGGPIGSAVEQAISKKINEGIVKLDSRLQSLPNQIPVDHAASLNITFVGNPRLYNSSIEFVFNGLFTAVDNVSLQSYLHKGAQASCNVQARMTEISLDESVLNSASLVHFNAGYMHWMVDKCSNQSLLNTAAWKYVSPELYIQYPNDNMTLNISIMSPPVMRILEHAIDATIYLDVTVNVLDAGEIIPVVGVLSIINASCSPQIVGNNLAGMLKLNNFNVSLKWSKVGDVHMHLVQSVAFTILETFFIPYINLHLMKGFPLPLLHGVALQNAEIHYAYSKIMICSNLAIN